MVVPCQSCIAVNVANMVLCGRVASHSVVNRGPSSGEAGRCRTMTCPRSRSARSAGSPRRRSCSGRSCRYRRTARRWCPGSDRQGIGSCTGRGNRVGPSVASHYQPLSTTPAGTGRAQRGGTLRSISVLSGRKERYEVDRKHQHGTECSVIADLDGRCSADVRCGHRRPRCVPKLARSGDERHGTTSLA